MNFPEASLGEMPYFRLYVEKIEKMGELKVFFI